MSKSRAGKPSRPYRGGHSGKGGSHEKGGCLAGIIVAALSLAGIAAGVASAGWWGGA